MKWILTNHIALIKKLAILNWKKCSLRDPTSENGQFVFKKKKSFLYLKCFRINNVHTSLEFVNSRRFLRKNQFLSTTLSDIVFHTWPMERIAVLDMKVTRDNHPHWIRWTSASLSQWGEVLVIFSFFQILIDIFTEFLFFFLLFWISRLLFNCVL